MQTSLVVRWFGVWLKCALTVLLALGPFLHAHYGVSHVSGLHMDGMNVAHVMHTYALSDMTFQNDADDESAAMGVVTSYPREVQLDVSDAVWTGLAIAWALFIAGSLMLVVLPLTNASCERVARHFYAPGARPPTLAPPALTY